MRFGELAADQSVDGKAGNVQGLYALLAAPKKLASFTVAEGVQFHCQPMAPQRRNEVVFVFDWLQTTLRV